VVMADRRVSLMRVPINEQPVPPVKTKPFEGQALFSERTWPEPANHEVDAS
jgi:hypothetical protein